MRAWPETDLSGKADECNGEQSDLGSGGGRGDGVMLSFARTWRAALVVPAIVLCCNPAHSQDGNIEFEGLMAAAKYSGFCGVISSMLRFQEETKMPGGDEFVARYINTEAARQGMTVANIGVQCKKAIAMYDSIMSAAQDSNARPKQ